MCKHEKEKQNSKKEDLEEEDQRQDERNECWAHQKIQKSIEK